MLEDKEQRKQKEQAGVFQNMNAYVLAIYYVSRTFIFSTHDPIFQRCLKMWAVMTDVNSDQ